MAKTTNMISILQQVEIIIHRLQKNGNFARPIPMQNHAILLHKLLYDSQKFKSFKLLHKTQSGHMH